jgi:hypothetical protein
MRIISRLIVDIRYHLAIDRRHQIVADGEPVARVELAGRAGIEARARIGRRELLARIGAVEHRHVDDLAPARVGDAQMPAAPHLDGGAAVGPDDERPMRRHDACSRVFLQGRV